MNTMVGGRAILALDMNWRAYHRDYGGRATRRSIMRPATAEPFQALWRRMEIPDIERDSPPIIWDADFVYGPRDAAGQDSYALCEINVGSVFTIPDDAPAAIARLTKHPLRTGGRKR